MKISSNSSSITLFESSMLKNIDKAVCMEKNKTCISVYYFASVTETN